MATVYIAHDAKHGRQVALKLLRADLAATVGPERFRREIGITARLHHPHILSVFDSGSTETGQLWYTMPYVEGETLRDRIVRDRRLPIEDALRITRELASALDYAHRQRIVHRDIKPENILLTRDGQALLVDFGLAHALSPDDADLADDAPRNHLTHAGFVVGTPQYMSPEQAVGDRSFGPRTDIYSLGAVCYEMLAGEPPFPGLTARAVLAKMASAGQAPSARAVRRALPVIVDDALRKALALQPADRWATAAEFAKALNSAERVSMNMPAIVQAQRRRFWAVVWVVFAFLVIATLTAAAVWLQTRAE